VTLRAKLTSRTMSKSFTQHPLSNSGKMASPVLRKLLIRSTMITERAA
jgi:hypothetical protein